MIGPNEDTPTRPGVARRATGEWEPITTGEWKVRMLENTSKPGASPLAIAAFVATAIGVFVGAVGLSLSIGDRLYYKATDGASLSTKLDAVLSSINEIKSDLKKDPKP